MLVAPVSRTQFHPEMVTSAHGNPAVDGFPLFPRFLGRLRVRRILIAAELTGPVAGQSTIPGALVELKHGS
jgi:hypothetical protein